MNPRTLLATAPLALALLIAGCSSSAAMPGSSDGMSKAPTAMSSDAMSKGPTAMATSAMSSAMMSAHGSYVTLADYTASMTKYADTKVVYSFHASWCPDCKAADTALASDPGSIPAKVTIVKVDYDTSTALKQKYGSPSATRAAGWRPKSSTACSTPDGAAIRPVPPATALVRRGPGSASRSYEPSSMRTPAPSAWRPPRAAAR